MAVPIIKMQETDMVREMLETYINTQHTIFTEEELEEKFKKLQQKLSGDIAGDATPPQS